MNTKKALIGFLALSFMLFPFVGMAQTDASLKRGSTGDLVRDLQDALKADPSIYPLGLVTGFFGQATENAIKNLQKKYGLPQTGVVDEATASIIYPNRVQFKVLAPNGGETWSKDNTQTILWEVTVGPISVQGRELAPSAQSAPSSIARPSVVPIIRKASIDLIKDSDPSYSYRIANVDLYQASYTWRIPENIPNASDYRIRISFGDRYLCLPAPAVQRGLPEFPSTTQAPSSTGLCPPEWPQYSSDTSDNVFSITGKGGSDTREALRLLISQMESTLNVLLRQLQEMKNLLSGL